LNIYCIGQQTKYKTIKQYWQNAVNVKKAKKYYAQHRVINPPSLMAEKDLQIYKNYWLS
jgi:hypothetical protein